MTAGEKVTTRYPKRRPASPETPTNSNLPGGKDLAQRPGSARMQTSLHSSRSQRSVIGIQAGMDRVSNAPFCRGGVIIDVASERSEQGRFRDRPVSSNAVLACACINGGPIPACDQADLQ